VLHAFQSNCELVRVFADGPGPSSQKLPAAMRAQFFCYAFRFFAAPSVFCRAFSFLLRDGVGFAKAVRQWCVVPMCARVRVVSIPFCAESAAGVVIVHDERARTVSLAGDKPTLTKVPGEVRDALKDYQVRESTTVVVFQRCSSAELRTVCDELDSLFMSRRAS